MLCPLPLLPLQSNINCYSFSTFMSLLPWSSFPFAPAKQKELLAKTNSRFILSFVFYNLIWALLSLTTFTCAHWFDVALSLLDCRLHGDMVVIRGLLHWCVLCVQHNDWYIVGTQKYLQDRGTNAWTTVLPEKFIGWTVQCPILLDHSVSECGNKGKWSVIFYSYSCFPQRIECDYFSNINSRFNNIIHILRENLGIATNAKIA